MVEFTNLAHEDRGDEGRLGGGVAVLGEGGAGGVEGTAGGVGEKDSGGLSAVQREEPAPPRPQEHTRSQTHFTASHSLALISLFISFPSPQPHLRRTSCSSSFKSSLLVYSFSTVKGKKKTNPLARSLGYLSAIQNCTGVQKKKQQKKGAPQHAAPPPREVLAGAVTDLPFLLL